MSDPFQDLSAASEDFVEQVATALEKRAMDPAMRPAIEAYLDGIPWSEVSFALEIGAGTAPIARMMAQRAPHARVLAQEPSEALLQKARALARGMTNLEFAVAGGETTGLPDGSQDVVVIQTVLSHVADPQAIMHEAHRVLRRGGWLAVCDVDFSRAGLASGANDPLEAMAKAFVARFVTDPFAASKLTRMALESGFDVHEFQVRNRVLTDSDTMRVWIEWPGRQMVSEGLIGETCSMPCWPSTTGGAKAATCSAFRALRPLLRGNRVTVPKTDPTAVPESLL